MFDGYTQLFCTLPTELQTLVLSYIDRQSLCTMFDLEALVRGPVDNEGQFLDCRHRALVAKHMQGPLIFSNLVSQSSINLSDIHYLMTKKIKLSPRTLTLSLFLESTDVSPACLYQYMCYLQASPQYVNLHLHARSRTALPLKVQRAMAFVSSAGLKVSALTVRHSCSGSCTQPPQSSTMKLDTVVPNEAVYSNAISSMESSIGSFASFSMNTIDASFGPCSSLMQNLVSLQLNLFAPTCLPELLKGPSGQALSSLDLAFNHITELRLSQICLPSTLRTLNLSNNNLHVLSNETLALSKLPYLESLNVSNNNLMRIEPFDETFCSALRRLDLSGNLLRDYSALFKNIFFESLQELDLSRNLLDSLTEIPKTVTSVGLTGNYFQGSVKRVHSE